MRVLILGAGAVGQVYGWALRGGAEVTFYMPAKYVEAARKEFVTYALNQSIAGPPGAWTASASSTATRCPVTLGLHHARRGGPALAGPWLAELLWAATDATVIMMHAGASGARETVSRAAPGRPDLRPDPLHELRRALAGDPAPEPNGGGSPCRRVLSRATGAG